jgi:hypothetical protein
MGKRLLTAGLLCAVTAAIPQAVSSAVPRGSGSVSLAQRLLRSHNAERFRMGLQPVQWDANLAAAAAGYAAQLAATGRWRHSPRQTRRGQGENLWMGTRGAFSPEYMVADWISEKAVFRPGVFPNVSRTGNWEDVGHYTQIVWPQTLRVGCALSTSRSYDYLVCRYAAPGNVMGEPMLAMGSASNQRMASRLR